MSQVDAFVVKQMLQALKLHFTTEKYDFTAYNGKLKAPSQDAKIAFQRGNQKHLFAKVGRHTDPKGLIIANLLDNPKLFITDLLTADAHDHYQNWVMRQSKLTYLLKQELEQDDLIHDVVKIGKNGMPVLLDYYIRKLVSPETIVIVDSFAHRLDMWASSDHPLVAKMQLRLRKYRSFVQFDKNRSGAVIKQLLEGK